ncbi:MAG: hypothetical protein Greene041619_699 [Candidatus Peregrinibacteria bacterium Greene0416_19]|nr:MAG: hypothetical protein Greene041619_699 [Candidatus Peregrinibacteria bacterium Greene0416_19]
MSTPTPTHRHRHLVVLPLFLAFVSLSVVQGDRRSAASAPEPHSLLQTGIVPDGAYRLEVSRGSRLDALPGTDSLLLRDGTAFIRQGSVLAAARGFLRLEAPGVSIRGIGGAAHLTVLGERVTVVAATTPLLLTINGQHLVVPVGMQWRSGTPPVALADGWEAWSSSRAVAPVPSDFIHRERAQAASLLDAMPQREMERSRLERIQMLASLFRLPPAQARAEASRGAGRAHALLSALEDGDAGRASALVRDPAVIRYTLLQPAGSHTLLGALLARPVPPSLAMTLLPSLVDDPGLWLLTSFHPQTVEASWVLPARSDAGNDLLALRLLTFPLADTGQDALPDTVFDRWMAEAQAFISRLQSPAAFTEVLLSAVVPVVDRFRVGGYPERTRRYVEALLTLATPSEKELSRKARLTVERLRHIDVIPLQATVTGNVAPTPAAGPSAGTLVPAEVERLARDMLRQAGAILTVHTTVAATGPDTASVSEVIFSGSRGERSFRFAYHAVSNTVSHIVTGETSYPFPMTVEEFVGWVRSR